MRRLARAVGVTLALVGAGVVYTKTTKVLDRWAAEQQAERDREWSARPHWTDANRWE